MANQNPSPTTRCTRGHSGDPAGRPAGTSLTAVIRAALDRPAADGSPVTSGHQLAAALVDRAVAGDVPAIELIFAYLEGQPIRRSESGEPGAFDVPIEDVPIETLRTALKRIT